MIAKYRALTTALAGLTSLSHAAPSIQMPNEWAAPLDSGKAMVLVEQNTGQARVISFDGGFNGTDSGPVYTNIPEITGLNTGLFSGGNEYAILSSVNSNSSRLLNTGSLDLTNFQPDIPGPITSIPLQLNAGDPPTVHSLSKYGDASEVLQRYEDLFATPSALGADVEGFPIYDLQPTLIPGSPDIRAGVASINLGGSINLYEVRPTPTSVSYSFISSGGVTDEKIATQCIGSDGRMCVIRYLPGDAKTLIVTQAYNGFPVGSLTSNALPFPIGSITAVPPGVPNAPDGVVVTSEDGTSAVYAQIDLGQNFVIVDTFTPNPGNLLNGIVPVIARGFLVMEGPAAKRITTEWRGFEDTGGGNWNAVSGGNLAPWLPTQQNFATMFWFNGTPLIDPTAEIVKLETRADWTRKTSAVPIPPQIELSELMTPDAGLIPTSLVAPSAPTGASFLLTSQYEDEVSITALDTDLVIQSPSLSISPASGNYTTAVTVTALFDTGAYEVFYREDIPGSPWTPFTPLTVGYPSSWLFYAENTNTGIAGPIVRRDFAFPGVDLNTIDTDRDKVPDYVERYYNLDPAGGTDTDGDFQSDLEEILEGNDAKDPNSNIPPTGTRNPPFLGEGFELIAQAYNASNQGASPANDHTVATTEDDFPGETLRAHSLHGQLLAESNVVELTAPPSLAGNDGAPMAVGTPVPEEGWITLSTALNFAVLDILNPPRTGREILKVTSRPVNPMAMVVHVPTGTDREADALAWLAAAQTAYGAHETVSSITELRPVDNAVSALAEQAIFDSLQTLASSQKIALGVPANIDDFTLFPQRSAESARTPFSVEMYETLRATGCDFPALMTLLETAAANATVESLANSITATHAANSETEPFMALPLDAFRSIIRTGAITDPAPGDPPRANPYAGVSGTNITSAKATFDSILGQVAGTKRPVATWFLVIGPSTTPLHDYDYIRQGTPDKVFLMDRFGDRVLLEQGLGLAQGAVFEITGFTDVTAPAGFTGLEFIQIESVVTPLASDNDTNGNLLDDAWENVFFGDLGVVGPFDPHPISGHSYLQYHLTGADPRSGSLTDPIVFLMPTNIYLEWIPAASSYDFHFQFPAEFFDDFNFVLESSEDLTGFSGPANNGSLVTVSPGNYRWRLQVSESDLDANFFRIGVSLAGP